MYKRIITVRLDRETAEKLEEICKKENRNRSNAVRVAVGDFYKKVKDKEK